MKISGTVVPLRDKIIVANMNFGEDTLKSGIIVSSGDGKTRGIHPRWAQVWAVGPTQTELQVGEWILMEHGRWSRGICYENDDGSTTEIRLADNNGIILASEDKPNNTFQQASK